ncbi:lipid hydroperoxide peroxidase, partial [Streptococcus agalactiae]
MTTFIGKPVTLIGQELKVGQIAPEFTLITTDLQKKSLTDFKGKKVISVIPSIDTGICSTQTRVFNKEVSEM